MRKKSKLTVIAVVTLLIISISIVGTITAQAADHPWPYHGQNTRGTRRSPYDTGHVDGTVKWSHQIPKAPLRAMHTPAIDKENNIYITYQPSIRAFNSEGELMWNSTLDALVSTSPALGPDGSVYAGGYDGILYVFDPDDGSIDWTFDTGLRDVKIRSDPVVTSKNEIYFGTDEGVFLAVDGNTRTEMWRLSVPQPTPENPRERDIFISPAIADDGTVYFGSLNHYFYAVKDGDLLWDLELDGQIWSSPAIADDGTIYVGDRNYGLVALSPEGEGVWNYQILDEEDTVYGVMSSPAIGDDGTIYFGAMDKGIYALYPDEGLSREERLRWHIMTDAEIMQSSPAVSADGTVYIGSFDKVLYAVGEKDGHVLLNWYYNTTGPIDSSPAIGPDGTVYVGNIHGEVLAFTGEEGVALNWWIIGSVLGIIAGVAVAFFYKKYKDIS
ncbi:MAG: PQQ-binding-like beta-propeller repeat protein [Thermoplasmata archaeon]